MLILLILLLTNLKINIRYANLGGEGRFRVKVYIFKFLRVFKMTKIMKSEKKKFRDQIKMIIDYLFKSKADPIEYAEKELKKSKDAPNIIKNIDITKIFIDYFSLDLFLDFDNAAVTAVTTGAANAILGMVLSKYADNITGPVRYKVYPEYTGEGVRVNAEVTLHIKILELLYWLKK